MHMIVSVILPYISALKVVYSSHPTYARCSKYGGQYSQACSKVRQNINFTLKIKFKMGSPCNIFGLTPVVRPSIDNH